MYSVTSNNKLTSMTAADFVKSFNRFIKEDYKHTDSTDKTTFDTNANKRIKKYGIVVSLLKTLPQDVVLEAETTPNGKYNIGTLCETILNAIADDFKKGIYHKAIHGEDIKIGNKRYEIKTSLSCYCKSTPCKANEKGKYRATILLNSEGVWLINSADVPSYLTKTGSLPWQGECGREYKRFTKALQFEGEDAE